MCSFDIFNTHLNAYTDAWKHEHVTCNVVVSLNYGMYKRRFCLDKHLCLAEKLSSFRARPHKDLSYCLERENKRGELLHYKRCE